MGSKMDLQLANENLLVLINMQEALYAQKANKARNQSAFIRDKGIVDNVLLAQELVLDLDRINRGGNLIFKLDSKKAYDTISWKFIEQCFQRLLKVRKDVEQLYVSEIGEGLVNIWWDNWSLEGCLLQDHNASAAPVLVKDIWVHGKWNLTPILPFCSPSQLSNIQKLFVKPGVKDIIAIKKNPIPSQPPQLVVHWGHTIWNKFLTPSMSFFIWRLFLKLIPTDDILKLKGLRGPSRCTFCQSQEETITHLFFDYTWVQEVWPFVNGKLMISTMNLTWKNVKLYFGPSPLPDLAC
ncbi:uncharacterized protein LOC110033176 [Phalaenopsis equestris]|uniref:uncharacterized protein LOC110033176 n=1 Tax=Phalaenopsis equestris TaxID=78828 RepID=UPI0009E33217|nr:uncharacterized protein LOC110033176 [Phalaenopsis equestris]